MHRWRTENEDVALRTRPRSGHPRKITPVDANRILEYVEQHPITTSAGIVEALRLDCNARLVRNTLHEQRIRWRRPAKKVELLEHHVVNRLNFAQTNLNRNWDLVIFSDEKVFSTSQEARKLVWRPNYTRYEERNVVRIRQSSRINLAYWGWMSSAGPGELVRIDGRMDATQYIRILEEVLLPSVRIIYPAPHRITLVQDNSAVHSARVVKDWFAEHRDDIEVLPWPAKSPDLNPIENLWAAMGRMWDARDGPILRNEAQLHGHVNEVWERFRGMETCSNLVASMRARLQEVLDRNGYWTHY